MIKNYLKTILITTIYRMNIVDSYSASRKTASQYRTFFGIKDEYIYECLLKYLIHLKLEIEGKSPGYIKVLTADDLGVGAGPRSGFFCPDYTEFRMSFLAFVKEFYDIEAHERSVDNSMNSPLFKLHRLYYDKYGLRQTNPAPHGPSPFNKTIDFDFELSIKDGQDSKVEKISYNIDFEIPHPSFHDLVYCELVHKLYTNDLNK